MRDVRLLVGVMVLAFATVSHAGPEARYTALSGNALCSEPLNNTDDPTCSGWDPSDSPDASECSSNLVDSPACESSNEQLEVSTSSLSYGGSGGPARVYQHLRGWSILQTKLSAPYAGSYNITSNDRRVCSRIYMRIGDEYQCPSTQGPDSTGICPTDDGKLFENDGNQLTFGKPTYVAGPPNNCGQCGQFNLSIDSNLVNTGSCPNGDDCLYSFSNFTGERCREDGSGNGGWCRVEICAEASGSERLDQADSRRFQVRMVDLDDGYTETLTTPTVAFTERLENFYWNPWNNLASGEQSRLQFSHLVEAKWSTDGDLWIGAASEIEPDADGDGIINSKDKCKNDARNVPPLNCDTDTDGYGNVCDGDFNQDGAVLSGDYSMFFVPDFEANPPVDTGRGTDMNCDGSVLSSDYSMFFVPQLNQAAPGPSGLNCAGSVPCN